MSGTPFTFESACLGHVGLVREANEDAWLARPDLGLWAVADGMGGQAHGDLASRLVVEALDGVTAAADARDLLRQAEEALSAARTRLAAHQAAGEAASTAVVLLAFDRHAAVVWAGDSRLYRLRQGRLERLTRDHSLVQELVDRHELDPEEARHHPLRNRVTRAIGAALPLQLDYRQEELLSGDRFLLCSDGLTEHLDDTRIAELLGMGHPADAARALIEVTLAEGASDNVTVVVVEARALTDERTHRLAGQG